MGGKRWNLRKGDRKKLSKYWFFYFSVLIRKLFLHQWKIFNFIDFSFHPFSPVQHTQWDVYRVHRWWNNESFDGRQKKGGSSGHNFTRKYWTVSRIFISRNLIQKVNIKINNSPISLHIARWNRKKQYWWNRRDKNFFGIEMS